MTLKRDGFLGTRPDEAGLRAAQMEGDGYAGAFTAETSHDPFLPLLFAARETESINIGTAIAVAFARTPMTLANTARDLNEYSEGRMILGLGSQIKPHITKRFSMPWSSPAARMREFILALHAIWDAWDTGEKLAFRGEFYTHTLMTDFFDPGPAQHGRPEVYLAAVGPLMVKNVAEVCDGWMVHPFNTPDYFEAVARPRMLGYMDDAGRDHSEVVISIPAFVVTGNDEAEMSANTIAIKNQIGFYGSTPAYLEVLEYHGWGEAHSELNALTKAGKWDELHNVIDDDMLSAFSVVADPKDVDAAIEARYGHLGDRIMYYESAPGT